jgi:hypothetical protein
MSAARVVSSSTAAQPQAVRMTSSAIPLPSITIPLCGVHHRNAMLREHDIGNGHKREYYICEQPNPCGYPSPLFLIPSIIHHCPSIHLYR